MTDAVNHKGVIGGLSDAHFIIGADQLTGERVVTEKGDHVGEILHIMLDIKAGEIAYAVLAYGGFLGMGEKLFAIPWHCLALDITNKWFVVNIAIEKLKSAPGFDKEHWPSVADSRWTEEVRAYYGPVATSRRPFI